MKVKISLGLGILFAVSLVLIQSGALFSVPLTCGECWDDQATQAFCENWCQVYVGMGCSYTIPTWTGCYGSKCYVEFWSVCLNGYHFLRTMKFNCPVCGQV